MCAASNMSFEYSSGHLYNDNLIKSNHSVMTFLKVTYHSICSRTHSLKGEKAAFSEIIFKLTHSERYIYCLCKILIQFLGGGGAFGGHHLYSTAPKYFLITFQFFPLVSLSLQTKTIKNE